MDAGTIIKWGLIAVAGIYALRFVSGLLGSAMASTDNAQNTPVAAQNAGYIFMAPAGVYPRRGSSDPRGRRGRERGY
jgi:hypothetical protein